MFERLRSGRLNRKQRKEPTRRLSSADPGLEVVHRNAAGIDVGNESHLVAVPPGRDPEPVREFGCWTADWHRMADWLKACGSETQKGITRLPAAGCGCVISVWSAWAHPPDRHGDWGQARVVEAVKSLAPSARAPSYVIVGVEHPFFNANVLGYLKRNRRHG